MTAYRTPPRRTTVSAFLIANLLLAASANAQMIFSSVDVFAASNLPATINSNSGHADVASFKAFVEAQEALGNGGIIDFEIPAENQLNANSITANYDGGAFVLSNDDLYFGNNYNTNNNNAQGYTSGTRYLGFEASNPATGVGVVGTQNTFTLPGDRLLTTFGVVALARGADRTPSVILGLSDSSTVVLSGSTAATGSAHALLAYTTAPGISITSIAFGNGGAFNASTNPFGMGGFVRWDELTFVTSAPVPEPSTYAMLAGLGALGFVACRRRSAGKR